MNARLLTVEEAEAAKIAVVKNRKYTQTVLDVITAYRANRRSGTANTKTKGEVNLSGSKPWKQKGTGRARAGYKSSPVWRGGGVVFGPKPRDYSKKINVKVKRVALRKTLSARIIAGDVLIVDDVNVTAPKTKVFVQMVAEATGEPKTLVLASDFTEFTFRAARNVQATQLRRARDVNAEDLLRYRKILITPDALTTIASRVEQR